MHTYTRCMIPCKSMRSKTKGKCNGRPPTHLFLTSRVMIESKSGTKGQWMKHTYLVHQFSSASRIVTMLIWSYLYCLRRPVSAVTNGVLPDTLIAIIGVNAARRIGERAWSRLGLAGLVYQSVQSAGRECRALTYGRHSSLESRTPRATQPVYHFPRNSIIRNSRIALQYSSSRAGFMSSKFCNIRSDT